MGESSRGLPTYNLQWVSERVSHAWLIRCSIKKSGSVRFGSFLARARAARLSRSGHILQEVVRCCVCSAFRTHQHIIFVVFPRVRSHLLRLVVCLFSPKKMCRRKGLRAAVRVCPVNY